MSFSNILSLGFIAMIIIGLIGTKIIQKKIEAREQDEEKYAAEDRESIEKERERENMELDSIINEQDYE